MILVSPCAKPLPKSTKKDTFHNIIFGIDKRFIFYVIIPRVLAKLSLSKGVVDRIPNRIGNTILSEKIFSKERGVT
jgi:hypothetical protein